MDMKKFTLKIKYRNGWFDYFIRETKTNDLRVFGCYPNTKFKKASEVEAEVKKNNPKYF